MKDTFLVKLNKEASDSFQMLTEVYGENCMTRAHAFELHKRFMKGPEDVEDDEPPGRPSTPKMTSHP